MPNHIHGIGIKNKYEIAIPDLVQILIVQILIVQILIVRPIVDAVSFIGNNGVETAWS